MVDQADMEDRQLVRVKRRRKKRTSKKRLVLFAVLLLLLLLCTTGSVFSLIEYQAYSARYHSDLALAQIGIQHLRSAEALLLAYPKNFFDSHPVTQAQQDFTAALPVLTRLDTDLKSLPTISRSIPKYGAQLDAALHLLPIAIEISRVGIVTCTTLNLLISRFHSSISRQGQGLTTGDLSIMQRNVQQIKAVFSQIVDQVNHLQPADLQLDSRLGKLFNTFHRQIPILQAWLDTAEKFLPVFPVILGIGTPANYLVEVLDSTELRPGGGFIGNYGIATISGARLIAARITDTYLFDKPFIAAGHTIPFPATYSWFDLSPEGWSLRDSNLEADFPTAARDSEQIYKREGGNVPVQGVIAITPALMQRALTITGPIKVPEYHETVTPQNLVARIHYYQLGRAGGSSIVPSPDGYSSTRKHFTALFAKYFLTRVRQLPSSAVSTFVQLLLSGLHSKDIQIYFNLSTAEKTLQQLHLDGAIQSSNGDGLFVVDANISANKANSLITDTLNDQVAIDAKGNATHHTTISYAWIAQGQLYGSSVYRDYMRVYVPPGSTLHVQDGWQPRGASAAFGREVWAGFFTLSYGQTRTVTLIWTVPAVAKKDVHGWQYQYLIQRQAGAQWKLDLQVTLPPCAILNNKSGGLVSSNRNTATLNQPLKGDLNLGIDYTC